LRRQHGHAIDAVDAALRVFDFERALEALRALRAMREGAVSR
jgi:hypothetical protein